jgi:ABC-type Fe3+/spermidine/putrescine transport system ATPase subunit
VVSRAGGTVTIETTQGPVHGRTAQEVRAGDAVLAGIRPEHIALHAHRPPDAVNAFEGTVTSAVFEGTHIKYRVTVGSAVFLVYDRSVHSVGARVFAAVDTDRVILLPSLQPTGSQR